MPGAKADREVFQSLTGLRFVLAIWITLYHLALMYGPEELGASPILAMGAARVDGFFLLSGFVLAHIYAVRPGSRFAFGRFLQARIARLYPLHLLALTLLATAVGTALLLGRSEQAEAYTLLGFAANLLMLQGLNVPGAGAWNFPAWTLSAEFFAYLCFPLFLFLAKLFAKRGLLFLLIALVFVAAVEMAWALVADERLGALTQNWGVLRGACGVLVGVALRYAFDKLRWSALQSLGAALSGGLLAGMAAAQEAPLAALHAAAGLMILGLAALDRSGRRTPLAAPMMQQLGEISFALFILHVPIMVIATQALAIMGWDGELNWWVAMALMAASLGGAFLANRLVEQPARETIRSWRASGRVPAAA